MFKNSVEVISLITPKAVVVSEIEKGVVSVELLLDVINSVEDTDKVVVVSCGEVFSAGDISVEVVSEEESIEAVSVVKEPMVVA